MGQRRGVFSRDTQSTSGIGWRAASLDPMGNVRGALKRTGATALTSPRSILGGEIFARCRFNDKWVGRSGRRKGVSLARLIDPRLQARLASRGVRPSRWPSGKRTGSAARMATWHALGVSTTWNCGIARERLYTCACTSGAGSTCYYGGRVVT
jgi:hypothetical protein